MNPRRLYRSRDRQLAGVAGGMAEYLDIDPTIVRILWILAALFSGGLMILAYIILAFVIPEAPFTGATNAAWSAPAGTASGEGWGAAGSQAAAYPSGAAAPAWSPDWASQAAAERQARERSRGRGPGGAVIVGTILVVFGVIALADAILPGWVGMVVVGPALVIALGAAFLVASVRRRDEAVATQASFAAPAPDATQAPFAAPAPDAAATGTGYDADATASVDLGPGADLAGQQPDTEPR